LVAAFAFVGLAVADDPDEPPIRLKKKPKKDDTSKKDDAAKKDDKGKKDGDDQKGDQIKKPAPKNPAQGEDERKKLVKRVLKNLRDAESRLAKKDPGKTTRKIQKDILTDLDALIKQTRQQSSQQSNQQQRQRQRQRQRQQNRNQRNQNQRNQKDQRNSQQNQNQQQQANDKNSKPNQGSATNPNQGGRGGNSGKKDDKSVDRSKTPWGHLPEKERQRIDEYTKAGNIPDYENLQQEYERTLSEEGNR
jgi:hypothetical protein